MTYYKTVIKLILSCSLLILASCSNSSDPNVEELPPVTLEAKSGLFTGTADFGSFAYNATSTKLVTFTLKNDGTEALTGPATIDKPENFSLNYSNCPSSLAKTKSCTIKVVFDPRGRLPGTYTANLNFDTVFVAMTAVIGANPNDPSSVDFLLSGIKIIDNSFGEIGQKQSLLKTFTIKNLSVNPINNVAAVAGSSAFSLNYSSCIKALAKNETCTVKVSFSGANQSGPQLANLTYGDFILPLSGTVTTPAAPSPTMASNIIIVDSATDQEITSKNIGTFSGAQSGVVSVKAKNTGNLASSSLTTGLTDSSNFQLLYDACSSQSLQVNSACLMKVSFGAAGKQVGTYATNVKVDVKTSGSLNAQVEQYKCPDGQHLELAGGPTNCVSDFKVCRTIPNGSGTQTWNGTDYGICKASSCNDGYILNTALNKCVSGGDPCAGVSTGQLCTDGLVFAGTIGNQKVQTTPGNCTNSNSPTCTPSTPLLLKTRDKAVDYCAGLNYVYNGGFTLPPARDYGGGGDWSYFFMAYFGLPGMNYGDKLWTPTQVNWGTPYNVYLSQGNDNFASDPYEYAGARCVRFYDPSCGPGLHVEGGSCVSNSRACTGTNSSGTQTWNGSSWGACSNLVCNSGFTMDSGGHCVIIRSCPNGQVFNPDLDICE